MPLSAALSPEKAAALARGGVIPAHPLAIDEDRKLDERRQRALTRYYLDAGAHGIAVAVHTTQFAIRDPKVGLFEPVLALAQEAARSAADRPAPITVAGVIGPTAQALREAEIAADLGYDLIMPQLGALKDANDDELVAHCARLAEIRPVFGFYLQPAVGGRPLSHRFWRRFAEIENVRAIKIAPFDRYATLDVVRAVAASGRTDVALYTGNDDHIALDLLTPFRFVQDDRVVTMRIVGGLLGHWAVWTKTAVEWFATIAAVGASGDAIDASLMTLANEVTDSNSALFDVSHRFVGSIAGIHEILRRQGLLSGRWCLDPAEDLSPGQAEEIDRVTAAYPHLTDDEFVRVNRDRWLS